jgi:phosphatidylserine/phosphatidylglycerophosphate/cardiolipin synthase-like enzyme
MSSVTNQKGGFSLTAYGGDAKTLLAFNLPDAKSAKNLAGFTIEVQPQGQPSFYLLNQLRFQTPSQHAQDAQQPANASINAPIHKFRWVHVPGSFHQGTQPFFGKYTYTATPRFFDANNSLQPLDPNKSVSVDINVGPFESQQLKIGFTRGFTQSQAFVNHFGLKALIRPTVKQLLFDTSAVSGTDAAGNKYTYQDEYAWLGFTARQRIFELLNEILNDTSLSIDMFAYDLNEPDVINILLKLAKAGRIRIILDNAALHHNTSSPKPEDQFETLFTAAAKKPATILRGHFGSYAHDKVLIVSNKTGPLKVLTGSTNFSVTGFYVNSNHVLIFDDPLVAAKYSEIFNEALNDKTSENAFSNSTLAAQTFSFASAATPKTEITFSPHLKPFATDILNGLVARIQQEGKKSDKIGSVLFAVMQIDNGTGPVYPALRTLHANQDIFSYGISDTTSGISLYSVGSKKGVVVTGKPTQPTLPPPFNQVPGVGIGHQVHHKFVVCGFNGDDPVVYCGSSNLALGGEQNNGDNLLAIHDGDVATAFAIEALALVDHFDFLDHMATSSTKTKKKPPASAPKDADSVGWFLSTDDKWTKPYFDTNDLHCVDRILFAGP